MWREELNWNVVVLPEASAEREGPDIRKLVANTARINLLV